MARRRFLIATAIALGVSTVSYVAGQQGKISPDLIKLAETKRLTHFNRMLSTFSEGTKKGVRLSGGPGEGLAYVEGVDFANGTIEFDVRGKDVAQPGRPSSWHGEVTRHRARSEWPACGSRYLFSPRE